MSFSLVKPLCCLLILSNFLLLCPSVDPIGIRVLAPSLIIKTSSSTEIGNTRVADRNNPLISLGGNFFWGDEIFQSEVIKSLNYSFRSSKNNLHSLVTSIIRWLYEILLRFRKYLRLFPGFNKIFFWIRCNTGQPACLDDVNIFVYETADRWLNSYINYLRILRAMGFIENEDNVRMILDILKDEKIISVNKFCDLLVKNTNAIDSEYKRRILQKEAYVIICKMILKNVSYDFSSFDLFDPFVKSKANCLSMALIVEAITSRFVYFVSSVLVDNIKFGNVDHVVNLVCFGDGRFYVSDLTLGEIDSHHYKEFLAYVKSPDGMWQLEKINMENGFNYKPRVSIVATPVQVLLNCMRISVLFDTGRSVEAFSCFYEAVALFPDCFKLYYTVGLYCENKKNYLLAIEKYNKALECCCDSARVYIKLRRGITYYKCGAYEQAIQDLSYVIERDNSVEQAYQIRGLSQLMLDDKHKEEALSDMNMAIKMNPNSPENLSNRALVYNAMSRFDAALSDCNLVIKLDPNFRGAYINRAHTLMGLGDYEGAVKDFSIAFGLYDVTAKPAYLYLYRAKAEILLGFEKARKDLSMVEKILPQAKVILEKISSMESLIKSNLSISKCQ